MEIYKNILYKKYGNDQIILQTDDIIGIIRHIITTFIIKCIEIYQKY
jgi:hypothetical protein